MSAPLLFDQPGAGVCRLRLNRPARRNALDRATWQALTTAFTDLAADPAVRVIVLAGSGGHFCSGADIGEFEASRGGPAQGVAYEALVDGCHDRLVACPKPMIAAISGFALGSGLGLAAACDFRVAAPDAQLGVPAARLGLTYGQRETQALLQTAGLAVARRLLFGAERLSAAAALDVGLIDRIAPDAEAEALAWAEQLAANAPLSIAGAKLMLRHLARGPVPADQLRAAMDACLDSADYREGVAAFKERRPPRFTGR